ncbi:hypothetical protein GGU10DRAFT_332860 [Lentinula aff. detonsa]|uniref:Uncharacterized protein n=1 Tax=Lentinula aff. detonsa TaxID=2804958 RepID=A0AA38L4M9_9AGAR|nr:hypothetical protein GGU10DRAFT_332860 [Lentinula aff. detonsa]
MNYGSPYSLETLALNLSSSKPARRIKAGSISIKLTFRAYRPRGLQKGRPRKPGIQSHLLLDLSSTKDHICVAHFENAANLSKVFQIFGNPDTLIAETNKLLKARANSLVKADPEYRLVHDLEDDLDYINTAMIFLTLFQTSPGNPLLTTADLSHWKTRYEEFNRIRGFNTVKAT